MLQKAKEFSSLLRSRTNVSPWSRSVKPFQRTDVSADFGIQDPFSNYVVQYCLEFDRRFVEGLSVHWLCSKQYLKNLVTAIIRQFQGNICALSCHKFSSNVIEKVGLSPQAV